jgi:hypothetical protein
MEGFYSVLGRDIDITGEQLKAVGQQKALKRAGSAWLTDALAALKVFLTEQYSVGETDITFDQFRALARTYEPANPNAWGALPRAAIKAGYIKSTTRTEKAIRPKAQCRVVRVWDINPETL